MSEEKQFRAIVRGRVQGVYYRATTVDEAQALGLKGYARNMPDGSVEVVARGEEIVLKRFIEYLHRGPTVAHVTAVEIVWGDYSPAPDPFEVKY